MAKLKFGDVVRHKNGTVFIVLDFEKDDDHIACVNGFGDVWSVNETELELIPNPDTVRLDWLENNQVAVTKINGEVFVFVLPDLGLAKEPTIRQAIDNAMNQE